MNFEYIAFCIANRFRITGTPPTRPTLSGPLCATTSPMLPNTGTGQDLVSISQSLVMPNADTPQISGRKFLARRSLPSRLSTVP